MNWLKTVLLMGFMLAQGCASHVPRVEDLGTSKAVDIVKMLRCEMGAALQNAKTVPEYADVLAHPKYGAGLRSGLSRTRSAPP